MEKYLVNHNSVYLARCLLVGINFTLPLYPEVFTRQNRHASFVLPKII